MAYVPSEPTWLVGFNLGLARRQPQGPELIARIFGQSGRPGLLDLPTWVGVDADAVDHLIIAARLGTDSPRGVLIVHARRPIDLAQVRERLKARSAEELDGRTVHPFTPTQAPWLSPVLWAPTSTDLVVALETKHLQDIPDGRRPNRGLPAPMRDILHNRVGTSGAVWVVGHSPAGPLAPLLWLAGTTGAVPLSAETRKSLETVPTVGLWARLDAGLSIVGEVEGTRQPALATLEAQGPEVAEAIRALSRGRLSADGRDLLDALLSEAQGERREGRLTFTLHVDRARLSALLRLPPTP
jgi:hypothetical protein